MTKQAEIRKGIFKKLMDNRDQIVLGYYEEPIKALLSYLHSQGVVIKKEGELPEYASFPGREPKPIEGAAYLLGMDTERESMLEAGYTLTEPLIEADTG